MKNENQERNTFSFGFWKIIMIKMGNGSMVHY